MNNLIHNIGKWTKSFVAVVAFALSGVWLSANCATFPNSGTWTDENGVTWKFQYNSQTAMITGAFGYGDELFIPDTVEVGTKLYEVIEIGTDAFNVQKDTYAAGIYNVDIPGCVQVIGSGAFKGGNVKWLGIESGVQHIKNDAFYGCPIEEVDLPSCISSIGDGAFENCLSLISARFDCDTNVYSIDMDPYAAFKNTPYISKVIASNNDDVNDAIVLTGTEGSVTARNDFATMQTINGEDEQAYIGMADSYGTPMMVNNSLWWEWTAPAGVTEAAFYAYSDDCNPVLGVYLNSAKTIQEGRMGTCAAYKGYSTMAFLKFVVTPGETYCICVAAEEGSGSGDVRLGWKATTGGYSPVICDGSLISFVGKCPQSITIPNTVTHIFDSAFDSYYNDVSNLKSVVIPESVVGIGNYAFFGCENLASVTFNGCGLRWMAYCVFSYCQSLAGKTIELPVTVEYLTVDAFSNIGGALTVRVPQSLDDVFTSGTYGEDFPTTLTANYFMMTMNGLSIVRLYPEDGYFGRDIPYDDGDICTSVIVNKGKTYWSNAITRKTIRPGYVFDGFWTAATGGKQVWDADMKFVPGTGYWGTDGKWTGDGISDMRVYAHWKTPELTIGGGKTSMSRTYSCEAKSDESFSVACGGYWTATASANWITINSGAAGCGNGKVIYSFSENTGTSKREAKITVQCGKITRTCTIAQDKPLLIGGKTSLSRTYEKTAQSDCYFSVTCSQSPWTAVSSASWVTLHSDSKSGTGSGKIYYNVSANTSSSSRSATIKVTSRGLTRTCKITQKAGAEPTLTIGGGKTSMSRAYSCEPKTGESFSVACNGSWTATASASWITITSGASGSGNGTIKYSLAENTGTSKREGTIKVKCGSITRTCTITQDKPLLIGGSTSMTRTYGAAEQMDCCFTITCSQSPWTAVSSASSWVMLHPGSKSGNGTYKIYYDVAANTSTRQRTATIKVTSRGLTRTCTIKQKGK